MFSLQPFDTFFAFLAPTTMLSPQPFDASFAFSHPITQQPAKSSIRLAAQLECGILSWLETHIGLGLTSVEPRRGNQKY
jgi:hypothetical protein